MFLRNVDIRLQDCAVSLPRTSETEQSLPQNLNMYSYHHAPFLPSINRRIQGYCPI
jgi:hypothetical protein